MKPYVAVANPLAGSGAAPGLLRAIEQALGGPPQAIIEPDLTPAFAARLNEAIRALPHGAQPPLVVCVGGDGTLCLTFNAIADPSAVTLGLVPCGSGNDVAVMLGIERGERSLATLAAGNERRIDYGTANGTRFLNCVGIGLDAEVASTTARIRVRGFAKGLLYYVAAVGGLFAVRPVGATVVTAAGSQRFDDLIMITIGNGRWYGGGFLGAPKARMDDGMFDCYAFADLRGFIGRFALLQRIRAGVHEGEPTVTALRADALTIAFDRPVAMHLDGEVSRIDRAEIALVPLGARVLAPPG